MSEASSSNQPIVDQTTGDVVGGLAGLREIMRMRQEMAASAEQSDDSNKSKTSRSSRRRNRRKSVDTDNSGVTLPIESRQIVYGEIVGQGGRTDDVKLFVNDGGALFIYTKSVFPGEEDGYIKAASQLLSDSSIFRMAKVNSVQIFLNKSVALASADDCLTYLDKYRIDCHDDRVLAVAKRLVEQKEASQKKRSATTEQADAKEVSQERNAEVKIVELSKQAKNEHDNSAGDNRNRGKDDASKTAADNARQSNEQDKTQHSSLDDLTIAKFGEIKKVADKMSQSQSRDEAISAVDLMQIFLLVGRASHRIATTLTDLDTATIQTLVSDLRLAGFLGAPLDDKTYPILVQKIDDLKPRTSDFTQQQFDAAVRTEEVRGKTLVYDLDEVYLIDLADEYIARLAEYCRVSRSPRLRKLFADCDKTVTASQVLRTVSGDDETDGLDVAEYELFHMHVTKYMLAAGWAIANPSDGFPWMQFQVSKTYGLTLDTLRYIMVNLDWIASIYNPLCLNSLAKQIQNLDMPNILGGTKYLQKTLCTKLTDRAAEVKKLDEAELIRANQLSLVSDENKRIKGDKAKDETKKSKPNTK